MPSGAAAVAALPSALLTTAQRFCLVSLRLLAARGFTPPPAKPSPALRSLGFCPRSAPSALLPTAQRFCLVSLRLLAARGFTPPPAKPSPALRSLGFCPRSAPSALLPTAQRFCFAARINSRNSGWARLGRDFSSGWNWHAANQGCPGSSTTSTSRPSGDRPDRASPAFVSASR